MRQSSAQKHHDDENKVFSKQFTNHKGYPCSVVLLDEGESAKLIIFVKRTDGDLRTVRYVSVLSASIMDEVSDAWLAYREEVSQ
ncbi:MAG TPA: hypothetical protein VF916_00635 [Ktedonobacterales bacterium]